MTTTHPSLASGTYEILRNRLRDAAADLRSRFVQLNEARATVFGNVETKLLTTTHVTTDHSCVPRDLFAIQDHILLGYNVQFGLKTEVVPSDVLATYRFDGQHAKQTTLDALSHPQFHRDFQELYRYYRNATFLRFCSNGPSLFMVFQTGKTIASIKAFKWLIEGDSLRYVDNRSEAEIRPVPQHAFEWTRATRDSHRHGKHPHISIEDRVFVECVHGDLTVKIEDNTDDGLGIYREPVDSPDQTLDDAETYYAILNNLVLLKIKPYQERAYRYLVFNSKRRTVERLDSIGQACALLPDEHGIIFSNGFVLQTGDAKLFDHGLDELSFERSIKSPNGEDFLYLFRNGTSGLSLQLRYNLIRQEVDTPLISHGQAFFDDGGMLSMRAGDTPQRHHALQLWQTPFSGPDFRPKVQSDSILFKIGNRDLVRGMAECQELLSLIDKDESYADLYADLAKRATDILDGYFWLDREEAFKLSDPIANIRETATAAVDEFEKVVRVREATASATDAVETESAEIIRAAERIRAEHVEGFVEHLASLRSQRGKTIQLKELKYSDSGRIDAIETRLVEATHRLGVRCVQFLLEPHSLQTYSKEIADCEHLIPNTRTAAETKQLGSTLNDIGSSLELLSENVSQLKIDDLAQRTNIVDRIGDVLALLNRVRSTLKTRLRELTTGELESDFLSQAKLLDQSAASAIDSVDSPEKADSALTRILVQVEELEGRYSESETLLLRLTEKRQSLCDLFESKRQQLVESQTRRANALVASADRILSGIESRATRIDEPTALIAYFSSDVMVDKVRKIANQLLELGDSVRRDDLLSRLKSISDDSQRQQRDRLELQTDGNRTIRFGQHTFSINQQPIELTTVVRNRQFMVHLTGTQFYQPVEGEAISAAADLWDQLVPSESEHVYRAEYLAYKLFLDSPNDYAHWSLEEQVLWVRDRMQQRQDEGYVRGVHDSDAAAILSALVDMRNSLGLLKFSPTVRGKAWFRWHYIVQETERKWLTRWIRSSGRVGQMMKHQGEHEDCLRAIEDVLRNVAGTFQVPSLESSGAKTSARGLPLEIEDSSRLGGRHLEGACYYLVQRILQTVNTPDESVFESSPRARELFAQMEQHLVKDDLTHLLSAIAELKCEPAQLWSVAGKAIAGFLQAYQHKHGEPNGSDPVDDYRDELTALLIASSFGLNKNQVAAPNGQPWRQVTNLVGDHSRIVDRSLYVNYHHFLERLARYEEDVVPRWQDFYQTKRKLLAEAEARIKSREFKAKVLTSFVRNQLIDEVYLPRIGDNLAKQIGTTGENKRTDRMGLLLLISPPGYGKTTLMEYVANRLGLVFVKVNGPAIGHSVTSLDPSEATNAAAREEVRRINMALEMGDNVMLYLDDIQHCNVELLQKFIPLCDATRRIEGVWNGESKTYDLRGRKFAVVMAGNPYTESGDRFQIPDMLANRADVYNLGEIIGDSRVAFEQSYLENCLTSNPVLQPLSRCSNKDQRTVLAAVRTGTTEAIDLDSNLSSDALSEIQNVLVKLMRVRDVVLAMNQAYIQSAAQSDDYRTEPPFKLQGSYRNMNRIAEKVVSVMNDEELERLIESSYQQDSQTLSRDSESNLLKFRELLGTLNAEQTERWQSIKRAYVEKNRLKGLSGDDATAQVLSSLLGIATGLESIRSAVENASRIAVNAEVEADESSIPETKVIVQHSVPRVMTELIRSQFQLLYDGLRPVLENVADQSQSSERLRATLQDLLERYKAMEEAAKSGPSE